MSCPDLAAWLAEQEASPPEGFWGVQDCWLFPADWVLRRTGRDPAARYRGQYSTAAAAWRLVWRAGGPVPFADGLMAEAGWVSSASPRRGQVGLLAAVMETNGVRRPCLIGGVCLGGGWWASRTEDGLLIGQAQARRCWRPDR